LAVGVVQQEDAQALALLLAQRVLRELEPRLAREHDHLVLAAARERPRDGARVDLGAAARLGRIAVRDEEDARQDVVRGAPAAAAACARRARRAPRYWAAGHTPARPSTRSHSDGGAAPRAASAARQRRWCGSEAASARASARALGTVSRSKRRRSSACS